MATAMYADSLVIALDFVRERTGKSSGREPWFDDPSGKIFFFMD